MNNKCEQNHFLLNMNTQITNSNSSTHISHQNKRKRDICMQTKFSDTKFDLCIFTPGVKTHKPGAGAVGCTCAAPGEQWGLGTLHRGTPAHDLSWD